MSFEAAPKPEGAADDRPLGLASPTPDPEQVRSIAGATHRTVLGPLRVYRRLSGS